MARYKITLVVCYVPFLIMEIVIAYSKTYSSRFVVIWEVTAVSIYFNSTLDPFLYCWKIIEVRKAVKQTINQTNTLLSMELDPPRVRFLFVFSKPRVTKSQLSHDNARKYILLAKREERTGRISARGLDSTYRRSVQKRSGADILPVRS